MNLSTFEQKAKALRVLGYMVSIDGKLVAKKDWDGECRRNLYSASKSYTSTAVGFAVQEGLLSLEEKLVDAFPEELPENVSDHLEKATVRDLLTMCLGQGEGHLMGGQRPFYPEHNWVKLSLAQPFDYAPGTHFQYNNVGPYLAGVLVQRRAGCDLTAYLTPRLFAPMGIVRPTWEVDPNGYTFGAGGLFLCLTEFHQFGQFYLDKGMIGGKQLLSREWIEQATCNQVPQNDAAKHGYGYLFWHGEHGSYRADGKYCQLSIIFPDKNAVVTVVSECREGGALFRTIYDDLYPEL